MKKIWTFERIIDEAARFVTINDFRIGSPSAYVIAHRNGWFDQVASHLTTSGNLCRRYVYQAVNHALKKVYIGLTVSPDRRLSQHLSTGRFSSDMRMMVLTDLVDSTVAQKTEQAFIDLYQLAGYTVLNKVRGGALGGSIRKWTIETTHIEALKYQHKRDFQRGSNGAYQTACKNGWIKTICGHMTRPRQ